MLSVTATARAATFLDKYGCFKRPTYASFCVKVDIHHTVWILHTASTEDIPC